MVILGLGSNIGERYDYLGAAVWKLSYLLQDMRLSRVLESRALLPPDPEPGTDRPFLNMAVRGICTLPPAVLLDEVKTLEQELGRVARGVWGPREIDIDILAVDGLVYREEGLAIPHPGLLNRDFVLVPLADVAPDWVYPGAGDFAGKTAAQIVAAKGYGLHEGLRETGLTFHG